MLKDNSKETVTTAWNGFKGGNWQDEIDVRDFINRNYTPYDGDQSFLEEATEATTKLNDMLIDIKLKERAAGGVLDADTKVVSTITSHKPGYLDKDLEKIVGLQTDKPMKKALMPYGGIRMAKVALAAYGMEIDPETERIFTDLHKTHNQGVFDAYNDEIKRARHNKIVTGLPDSYGRGRIIADFPRVALYGIDRLIAAKKDDLANYGDGQMTDEVIRLREEVSEQIRALQDMKKMAASYGYDISYPATNAREAIQWLYFGYLASIKQQNGAAMSIGRIDSFIDIYIKRDMDNGLLTEKEAQELIDQFTMKLRMVTFIRLQNTTPCSLVTQFGQRYRSLGWGWMAVTTLQRQLSVSCTPCITWGLHQNQISPYYGQNVCQKGSRTMRLVYRSQVQRSNMKTMN